MLKNIFIVIVLLIFILAGAGYYAYTQRTKIAGKLVEYTMQSITGEKNAENNAVSGEDWVSNLLEKGIQSMQNALDDAVAQQNKNNANTENRVPGLATMAEMFANGTNGQAGIDLNQMAQAFVSSIGSDGKNTVKGNDINARDTKGRTLLMNMCRTDITPETLDIILKYGADINAKDNNGRTVLMYAVAFNKNPEVIAYLLKSGADAKVIDSQGKTALNYSKDEEITKLLKSAK